MANVGYADILSCYVKYCIIMFVAGLNKKKQ